MQTKRRALVIGGSVSGLFAALALSRRGWDVHIFERVETELGGRGAGIVAQPQLWEVFAKVGIDPPIELGVPVEFRRSYDVDGRLMGEIRCPQTLTSWDRIYRLLRDAFPAARYRRGKALARVELRARSVIAHFADGETAEGDLLIGADGLRSTVRAQLLPEAVPLYAGYIAWRALVPEAALSPATHRDLFGYMAFCHPPGEQTLGYGVAGPDNDLRPGHRSYNLVWYRPADEDTELPQLLTDATGTTHSVSIPPPLIRAQVIGEMRAAAERLLAPQFREIVRVATQPFIQPIYDVAAGKMAFGRVAILGDAAFVARPHVAVGVAKAAEDAVALAQSIEECGDVERGLARFEALRIGVGRRIIERARHLGAYLQSRARSPEERRRAEQHRAPAAVMAETAVLDFLSS
ncbi:MAG TPA: FAD binding domain-containing protein [Xanthobacteraceae bacterium]|nr:FAD binding domain-containing protein [Xanthobacteraceae bacterium]